MEGMPGHGWAGRSRETSQGLGPDVVGDGGFTLRDSEKHRVIRSLSEMRVVLVRMKAPRVISLKHQLQSCPSGRGRRHWTMATARQEGWGEVRGEVRTAAARARKEASKGEGNSGDEMAEGWQGILGGGGGRAL